MEGYCLAWDGGVTLLWRPPLGAAPMSLSASCILRLAVSKLRWACFKTASRSGKHHLTVMSVLETSPAETERPSGDEHRYQTVAFAWPLAAAGCCQFSHDAGGSITSYKNPGQAVAYMLLSHPGKKVNQFHNGIPHLSSYYWARNVDMNVEPHPACLTSDSALHELDATIFCLHESSCLCHLHAWRNASV